MEAAAIPVPKTGERWEQASHALKVRPEHAGLIGTLTVLSSRLLPQPSLTSLSSGIRHSSCTPAVAPSSVCSDFDVPRLQSVWASKYNERAFLSMKKVGLNFLDLRMAVLVQRVVPAAYAFVIHTENPTNGKKDEIFAELVIGLGESIVSGMVPGSSLSFVASKGNLDKPEVGALLLQYALWFIACLLWILQYTAGSYNMLKCCR